MNVQAANTLYEQEMDIIEVAYLRIIDEEKKSNPQAHITVWDTERALDGAKNKTGACMKAYHFYQDERQQAEARRLVRYAQCSAEEIEGLGETDKGHVAVLKMSGDSLPKFAGLTRTPTGAIIKVPFRGMNFPTF